MVYLAAGSSSWVYPDTPTNVKLFNHGSSLLLRVRHKKAKNTHLSRYGERWVEKLIPYSSMSKLCCIADLIRFIMKEAEKTMKGYVNEDDFFIIHDALVSMTEKEKIKWMKDNN